MTAETAQSGDGFHVPENGVAVPLDDAVEALGNIKRFGAFKQDFVSAYLWSDALRPDEIQAIGQIIETLGCRVSVALEVHGDPADSLPSVSMLLMDAGIDVHSMRQNLYGAAPQPNSGGKRIAMVIADPRERGSLVRVDAGDRGNRCLDACWSSVSRRFVGRRIHLQCG
ncbi:MAG TPA: hypothetical protein VKA94_10415 [Hyphomicrobiales bacterium]|nr:hypothetical protein [Hyphomicrobiales bacterium]